MPAPIETITPGITPGKELGKEETIELLSEETTEEEQPLELTEPPKKGKKEATEGTEEDEETTEEVDPLAEIEEELEEPDEEKLELMTPVRRREILTKYPKLFKDFPYLERAYYRDQQFTEILPTIQDAKAAVEKSQHFDNFERHLNDGNIEVIFEAMKDDKQAFNKIVDDLLPSLAKVNENAYYHVIGGVVKDTIVNMVREARAMGENGKPLEAAAHILNQYVFGSQKFTPHQKLSQEKPEESSKENELKQREESILKGQFESAHNDLQTRTDNVLKATIDQHIDPKQSMTDYVRQHASREAMETLENLIAKDTRFRSLLDKLWERAFDAKFDKTSTDRIKSAYLAKAKTLLPSVIKKARNDALKGLGRQVREDDEQEETTTRNNVGGPKKPVSQGSGKIRSAKDIPKGMSTIDALNAMD